MTQTRSISTFTTQCGNCTHTFAVPELSDFSYGDALLRGEYGTVHAYLNMIGHPVCERIASEIAAIPIDLLLPIAAVLADPIQGQRLKPGHICPRCQSTHMKSWAGDKIGVVDVPDVTFTQFNALPALQQRARIRALL